MKAIEKLKQEFPARENADSLGGAQGCPHNYGYLEQPDYCPIKKGGDFSGVHHLCHQCWNREVLSDDAKEVFNDITKSLKSGKIKDSGDRTRFESGAVRDMHEGKGDMASIPWESVLRLSRHYEAGAKKYKRWNYRQGIPISSFIDSACRHLAKYQCGMDDEDHLAAAAFNILGAMLMENTMPDMQDLPIRQGKKTFDYFE